MNSQISDGVRPARMAIRSAVLICNGGYSWSSELQDISATGVLVRKPEVWNGRIGDVFVLDMLIGDTLNIHVEAKLARVSRGQLGFAYARIPEDKQVPLWNLLGDYADRLEAFADEEE